MLETFALDMARRRFAYEHGCIWTAWFAQLSEDDEIRLADRELDAFTTSWIITGDLHAAIRRWLEEPDALGWPAIARCYGYSATGPVRWATSRRRYTIGGSWPDRSKSTHRRSGP